MLLSKLALDLFYSLGPNSKVELSAGSYALLILCLSCLSTYMRYLIACPSVSSFSFLHIARIRSPLCLQACQIAVLSLDKALGASSIK
jgi:hypothetical protein